MSITIENVESQWFDPNALRLPNYRVGRVNFGNGRSYIRIKSSGELETPLRLYTSLTTAIYTCSPMERPLLEWYCKHGAEEADRLSAIAAHYGTLMHLQVGKFLIEREYNFDAIPAVVASYVAEHALTDPEIKDWEMKLRYDMASFIQFYQDYEVIPLGIEYVLLSEKGFGTLIDLVCKLTVDEDGYWGEVYKSGDKKGEPKITKKRVQKTAIINFKSGRKGFYRTNGIQIECEKILWEENFPELPIDMALNWSPKDWTANPGYNLKDWTGDVTIEEVKAILRLAEIRYASKATNKTYLTISGTFKAGEQIERVIQKENIEQYCIRRFGTTPVDGRISKVII